MIAALDATGMLLIASEHLLAAALPSSSMLHASSGGASFEIDWCFVDCVLLRVCDLREVFSTLGYICFTLYPN